jgi:hypothetical protein
MSKSIRSFPVEKRAAVIERRLNQSVKGLGYLAAVDASKGKPKPKDSNQT